MSDSRAKRTETGLDVLPSPGGRCTGEGNLGISVGVRLERTTKAVRLLTKTRVISNISALAGPAR